MQIWNKYSILDIEEINELKRGPLIFQKKETYTFLNTSLMSSLSGESKISGIRNIEYQKYWVSKILGIRNIEYQKYRVSEILGIGNIGYWKYWVSGISGIRNIGY